MALDKGLRRASLLTPFHGELTLEMGATHELLWAQAEVLYRLVPALSAFAFARADTLAGASAGLGMKATW